MLKLDFDKYRNEKIYNGNSKKFGITWNGSDYIVKLSKEDNDMSVFCEYIASSFIAALDVMCHEVRVAAISDKSISIIDAF